MEVGEPCIVAGQCRGYNMSTVCKHFKCTCTKGYISLGRHCYEVKKFNKIGNKIKKLKQQA